MSKTALAIPPKSSVATIFDLADPNERRVLECIQTFYVDRDRLHALRRGTVQGPNGPVRMVWALGSFHPDRKHARVVWSVAYWHVDEIALRFQHCPDESAARAVYATATSPDWSLPGLRLKPGT